MTSYPVPFEPFNAFRSYAMSSFPPPGFRLSSNEELPRDMPVHPTHVSQQNVNLPPLSSIDPRQQRPSQSPAPAALSNHARQTDSPGAIPRYGSLLPSMPHYYGPPMNASGQYLGGSPTPMAPVSTGPRFPMPPTSDPNSIISGGRSKKDVKRRTKTGCLTCRKRRIKVRSSDTLEDHAVVTTSLRQG